MQSGDDIPNKVSLSIGDDHLIKVIAPYSGEFCYIDNLVTSLTHSEPKEIEPRPPLRRVYHGFFTVLGSGAFHRSRKPSPYKNSDSGEMKKFLSRAQSTTLITQHKHPSPYHAPSSKTPPEVGVILDPKDALFNRFFISSQRTWERPYEFNTKSDAEEYYKFAKNRFLFDNYDDFKTAVENDTSDRCNEVLARVRWNPTSCGIAIFNDTLEARLVAQIYAKKIKEALLAKSGKLPETVDSNYEAPIYFYLPKNVDKHFEEYSEEQQLEDRRAAKHILNNPKEIEKIIQQKSFVFLHYADNPASVLHLKINNRPIIIELIRLKLFHIANDLVVNAGEVSLKSYLSKNKLLEDAAGQFEITDPYLINAIKHGRMDLINTIIDIAPHLVNTEDEKGRTPLILSITNNFDSVTANLLRQNNIDIRAKDNMGNDALKLAFERENYKALYYLLNHKDQTINITINGDPLFIWVIKKMNERPCTEKNYNLLSEIKVSLLNNPKTDFNALNKNKKNVLEVLAEFGQNRLVAYIENKLEERSKQQSNRPNLKR